jgi:hypothetical protein
MNGVKEACDVLLLFPHLSEFPIWFALLLSNPLGPSASFFRHVDNKKKIHSLLSRRKQLNQRHRSDFIRFRRSGSWNILVIESNSEYGQMPSK